MKYKNHGFKIILIIAIYALVSSIIATSIIVIIELLNLRLLLIYIISYAIIISVDIFILYYAVSAILIRYNEMIKTLNEFKTSGNTEIVSNKKAIELSDSENAIVAILEKNGGKVLQNSLISKTGFSAPTISRILSSMESKGIIDRWRHGMTNEIVLKKM